MKFSDKDLILLVGIVIAVIISLTTLVHKGGPSKGLPQPSREATRPNTSLAPTSELIKKTGDANVTAAIARVSGVSTNGSFITVRGIGDRYIKTMINGMRIPTLDPFTNNIKLDIFPSSLVDNIIITKTAS
ncbi:MAG TPA: TonB-dependent receptor plug domain-containing protein, partial [Cyclobacteriaceae bacterium]|nr:TonB-dependent receptor plug domain-containing protein [Cyclobacteriaceae bacterium]